jgi:hypothetical protein
LPRSFIVGLVALLSCAGVGCGGDGETGGGDADEAFVSAIAPAIEAIEAELGPDQEFFEVTANRQLVNLFVAVDDATAAVPYLFLDGELQPPAPKLTGASGFTFRGDAVDFDESSILAAVTEELPESSVEALSIEGGAGDVVRYVVSMLSPEGGVLAVTVSADGAILEVDPL